MIYTDTDVDAFIARGWSLMTYSFTWKYEWNGFRKMVLTKGWSLIKLFGLAQRFE